MNVNYRDKRVLGFGDVAGQLKEALVAGALLVRSVNVEAEAELLSWEGRREVEGGVVVGGTSELRGEWDIVIVEGVRPANLSRVMEKATAALAEGGTVVTGKKLLSETVRDTDEPLLEAVSPPTPPKPKFAGKPEPNRNVILHVHNVRRCGGTGNFVYDVARAFPEFTHTALCVNDAAGDPQWIRDVSGTMRTLYLPQLTREFLDEVNPTVLFLHATAGQRLEGAWPYEWLQDGGRRYVVSVHHVPLRPILPADLDVFVSEHVKLKYVSPTNFLGRMKAHTVIPPCTDLAPYAAITRNGAAKPLVATTGGKHCAELDEVERGLAGRWTFDRSPPGRLGAMPGYLSRFPFAVVWSGHQETWCRTVTEALAAGCVTVAHRAGAIPEQIEHGVNGFLFDDAGGLRSVLDDLSGRTPENLAKVAEKGRAWAVENAGLDRLRKDFYPHFMKAVINAA